MPPKPPSGGRSASPTPPAQGLVGVMNFLNSVVFGLRTLLLLCDRNIDRLAPPNPPTLGEQDLTPPRIGGHGGRVRKSCTAVRSLKLPQP
ncbi:MAG TPA: hypothetical protein V6D30_16165 [Leptolyngbyaceae cyanobacterium]